MSFLPDILRAAGSFLQRPGDKFYAEITPSGKQVVKLSTAEIKRSAVRYPETGTIVETIVHKERR